MRKFLSRREGRNSLVHRKHKKHKIHGSISELESLQEETSSIFGSSSRASRRASLIGEKGPSLLKPDNSSSTPSSSEDVPESGPRRNGILHTLTSKKSSSASIFHQNISTNGFGSKQKHGVQKLVDPEWDVTTIKCDWLNIVDESSKDQMHLGLCRAELKGSMLYIYRPPQELATVSYFIEDDDEETKTTASTNGEMAGSTISDLKSNVEMSSFDDQEDIQKEIKLQALAIADSVGANKSTTSSTASSTTASPTKSLRFIKLHEGKPGEGKHDRKLSEYGHERKLSDNKHDRKPSESMRKLTKKLESISLSEGALGEPIMDMNRLEKNITDQKRILVYSSASAQHRASPSSESVDANTQKSLDIPTGVNIKYKSCICPHPDLRFEDKNGTILGGTIESICHTIAFYPSQDVADKLISILPMISPIQLSLLYFETFLKLFISESADQPINDRFKSDHQVEPQMLVMIPFESREIMVSRISDWLKSITEQFGGILLDDSCLRSAWNVLVLLDEFCDCNELKLEIHNRQKSLRQLTEFEDTDIGSSLDSLTTDKFLHYPINTLAYEINSLDHHFLETWNPRSDRSLSLDKIHTNYNYWRKNFLIFDANSDLHYLAQIIAHHLFEDVTVRTNESKRAHVLEKWVLLGEYLYRNGNMVSWLGIASFICSVPILRLKKVWSLIESKTVDMVRSSWAPIIYEVRQRLSIKPYIIRYRVLVPAGIGREYAKKEVVPYYGDIRFSAEFGSDALPEDFVRSFCQFTQKADYSVSKWDEFYNGVRDSSTVKAVGSSTGECGHMNAGLARDLTCAVSYRVKHPPYSLKDTLKQSLEAEPPFDGQYYRYHDDSRTPLFLGSYPSILFPKILDTYEIYDRKSLIGAIGGLDLAQNVLKNSASNLSSIVKSDTIKNEHHISETMRNTFLKHIRDLFNIDTFEFEESDSSLIFKTVIDLSEQVKAHISKRTSKSRPSSILFTENSSTKRFSSFSTSSFNLDNYLSSYQSYFRDLEHRDNVGTYSTSSTAVDSKSTTADQDKLSVPILAKAASTDRLIDLLVLTSSIFSSRIREEQIRQFANSASTNPQLISLKMDQGTFTITFFAVYRCFCSPYALLCGLRDRFKGAESCALSIEAFKSKKDGKKRTAEKDAKPMFEFPSWNSDLSEADLLKVNWKFASQIQLGVVESLHTLFEFYFDHFVDDLDTRDLIENLLEQIEMELNVKWKDVLKLLRRKRYDREYISSVEKILKEIESSFTNTCEQYMKNCYSPLVNSPMLKFTSELTELPVDKKLPDWRQTRKILEFIDGLDDTIRRITSDITVQDWIESFSILEVLTAKSNLSLFNYDVQALDTPDELLNISNIYHWMNTLVDVEKSADSKTTGLSFVIDKFPATIKAIFQFYVRLKNYFSIQLFNPSLTQNDRVHLMATILKILSICSTSMKDLNLFKSADTDEKNNISPRVPSLIESCLSNIFVSPQSRIFGFDWVKAAKLLDPQKSSHKFFETIYDLIPDIETISSEKLEYEPLTPCPGWIMQCLLSVTCFIPNMYVKNTSLVNFDKERFAYNCVINSVTMVPKSPSRLSTSSTFEFLTHFAVRSLDLKSIFEAAEREGNPFEQNSLGIFSPYLREQRKLLALEASKKSLFLRQIMKIPGRNFEGERFDDNTDMAGQHRLKLSGCSSNVVIGYPLASTESHHTFIEGRHKPTASISSTAGSISASPRGRFKLSGLFSRKSHSLGLSRSSINVDDAKKPKSLRELPSAATFQNERKPKVLYTVNLKNYTVFATYVIDNSFKLDSGNNSAKEFCFQAPSASIRAEWLKLINYSHRHWFFSHSLNKPSMGAPNNMVFGVPPEFVCMREGGDIPNIIEKILSELEYRGLEEVGLYRKSASLAAIQKIKDKINHIGDFNMEDQLVFDVHNLTGCIKCYLRELPDPLIGDAIVSDFLQVKELSKDAGRFEVYRNIFKKLPVYNYNLLERIIRHLKLVVEYKQFNKMTPSNLATILGGSLIEGCDPENLRKYFGLMTFVCEDLIMNYDKVFSKNGESSDTMEVAY